MTQQLITLGTVDNDHTGEGLREGGVKIQQNFTEVYANIAAAQAQANSSAALITTIKSDYVDPRDFNGWDRTGLNPVDSILQTAVSQAIAANVQLRIPVGLYLLANPVDLAPNLNDGLDMVGVSSPAGAVGGLGFALQNRGPDVIFKANFNDRPAFHFTAARWIHLANFQVIGLNNISQFQDPNDVKANYNVGGCRDTQWSPYCGIAIDAFNTTVPADGGYPGMSAKYNLHGTAGTSGVQCENVSVMGFVVGWGLCTSGVGSQTDTMTFYNCRGTICDTAVAVGQAQSKDCIFLNGGFGSCRTGFDGVSYGSGQGVPIPMYGLNFGYLHRLFNYSSQFGPLFLHDCYAESIRSVGNFGTGGSTPRGHCSIMNMQLSMVTARAPLPPVIFESFGLASVRDCNFSVSTGNSPTWNMGNDLTSPISFDTCTFGASGTSGIPTVVGATSTGPAVRLINCLSSGTAPYQPISDESTIDVSAFSISNRFAGPVRASRFANGTSEVFYQSANATGVIILAATGTTLTARAVTFTASLSLGAVSGTLNANWTDNSGWYNTTFSNGDVRAVLYQNGATTATWGANGLSASATTAASAANVALSFTATDVTTMQVGDIICWKMLPQGGSGTARTVPGWVISNIVGSAVTATPLFDVTFYDTVANNFGGTNLVFLQVQWAPTASLTCTTATSTTLTAVSPTTILKNGDWVSGSGLAANSRVVSGGGTATITLNKPTTASASGVNLFFGRFLTPSTTITW